jgi:hypothetical protein
MRLHLIQELEEITKRSKQVFCLSPRQMYDELARGRCFFREQMHEDDAGKIASSPEGIVDFIVKHMSRDIPVLSNKLTESIRVEKDLQYRRILFEAQAVILSKNTAENLMELLTRVDPSQETGVPRKERSSEQYLEIIDSLRETLSDLTTLIDPILEQSSHPNVDGIRSVIESQKLDDQLIPDVLSDIENRESSTGSKPPSLEILLKLLALAK